MKKYLITGGTGYIGSMLIKFLTENSKNYGGNVEITALVRDAGKAKTMLPGNVKLIVSDIVDSGNVDAISEEFDYVVHCAATTKSSYMVTNPVETSMDIVTGTQNVLKLAGRCRVKSMVFLSSMEIYGKIDCPDEKKVSEDELGYIDIFDVRSSYSMGKRMAENLCHAYYKEYGTPVKIARLSQTFGEGIPADDNRVFAQFAKAVLKGENIVLHTSGNAMGNYCYIADVIDALLLLLGSGKNGEAYNIVNERNTMTIREMAELVACRVADGRIKVVTDIPENNIYGYAPYTGLRLSSEKLRELGWKPQIALEEMYRRMIRMLDTQSKNLI